MHEAEAGRPDSVRFSLQFRDAAEALSMLCKMITASDTWGPLLGRNRVYHFTDTDIFLGKERCSLPTMT